MKLKSILFLLALTSLSPMNAFYGKEIVKDSLAEKTFQALNAFWHKKLSEDLKKECTEQKQCEDLTEQMSNVIAYALMRRDTAKGIESLEKATDKVAEIGIKAQWSKEKIEQEKKHVSNVLNEFLQNNRGQ